MIDEKEKRRQRLRLKKNKDRTRQRKREHKLGDEVYSVDWDNLPPSRPEWDYDEDQEK